MPTNVCYAPLGPSARPFRLAVAILLAALLTGACRAEPLPSTAAVQDGWIIDDSGDSLSLSPPRTTVVSLVPAVTDLLVSMGAQERLVARTRFDVGSVVAHLPSVGGGIDPDVETLVALAPDLVVVWPDEERRSAAGQVRALGLPSYAAEYQTFADVRRHARALGALLHLEREADSVIVEMDRRIAAVRTATESQPRPSVVYAVAVDPPMIAGGGTFVDSLIWAAGGRNAFAELDGWPPVSLEAVLAQNPDLVLLPAGRDSAAAVETFRSSPGWREVPAVAAGRILPVDPDLFGRPGTGLARAVEILAARLHPDRFP